MVFWEEWPGTGLLIENPYVTGPVTKGVSLEYNRGGKISGWRVGRFTAVIPMIFE